MCNRLSVFIIILILIGLWCPIVGQATDGDWPLLFEDRTGKTFINKPGFKSNLNTRHKDGYYLTDVWIYITATNEKFNIKQNWKFKTAMSTGKTQGMLLYNRVYDKTDKELADLGGTTNQWEDIEQGSFIDQVSLEVLKYDLLQNKVEEDTPQQNSDPASLLFRTGKGAYGLPKGTEKPKDSQPLPKTAQTSHVDPQDPVKWSYVDTPKTVTTSNKIPLGNQERSTDALFVCFIFIGVIGVFIVYGNLKRNNNSEYRQQGQEEEIQQTNIIKEERHCFEDEKSVFNTFMWRFKIWFCILIGVGSIFGLDKIGIEVTEAVIGIVLFLTILLAVIWCTRDSKDMTTMKDKIIFALIFFFLFMLPFFLLELIGNVGRGVRFSQPVIKLFSILYLFGVWFLSKYFYSIYYHDYR